MLVMTLLVRDEVDIVRDNLLFHLAGPVDHVIATDNGSQDGTREVLQEFSASGVLTLLDEPGDDYSQAVWVTRMADIALGRFGSAWILNNDADEFWMVETSDLRRFDSLGWGAVRVPRLNPLSPGDLNAEGVSLRELPLIDAVLRTYERGNAQNLVALCALRHSLDDHWPGDEADSHTLAAPAGDEAHDRLTEQLPPLPALDELAPPVQENVKSIARWWVPPEQVSLIPSAFRHLALWPGLLVLYENRLSVLESGPAAPIIHPLGRAAVERAASLSTGRGASVPTMGEAGSLSDSDRTWLLKSTSTANCTVSFLCWRLLADSK